ncbi:MAG: tRNA threonylcarbamoyladenosine dehydratase [Clostridiales bacterium]|nr:tRNA threonylcarbamoyladenosine dehydratase [Clostridiales bacterium]
MNRFSRTELLLGPDGMDRLARARVAVFGIGGVGGFAAEALVRSGLGAIDLFDDDKVCLTNLNRQIIATAQTVGRHKVEVMAERLRSINPGLDIAEHRVFYLPENADAFDLRAYDYVLDCVDTVAAKLELAVRADRLGVPIISAMGAGNKLDPTRLTVADIYETKVCPLARVMRRELRRRGVERLKVVYSDEEPVAPRAAAQEEEVQPGRKPRRAVPGSTAFVPSVMGLIMAGAVVRDISGV